MQRHYLTEEDKQKAPKKETKEETATVEVKETEKNNTDSEEKVENEAVDLESMTLTDLKKLAKEKEVKGYSTMKKQELIDALR